MQDPSVPPQHGEQVSLETVCHRTMTTAPENYHRAEYQGRVIYFCTEFCLDAFNADPERFYAAHSRLKNSAASPHQYW